MGFGLAYVLVQSVELDLDRSKLTAESADKMKQYIDYLSRDANLNDIQTARATALSLGGFGGLAAYPLIAVMEIGDPTRISLAMSGLEQAGRIAPEATCDVLLSVMDDPTETYDWLIRKAAVQVAGKVGCDDADEVLVRLQVAPPGPDDRERDAVRAAIDVAQKQISAARLRRKEWWEIF